MKSSGPKSSRPVRVDAASQTASRVSFVWHDSPYSMPMRWRSLRTGAARSSMWIVGQSP